MPKTKLQYRRWKPISIFRNTRAGLFCPNRYLPKTGKNIHVIDTRDAEQYQKAHIPGAVNIDWRKVLGQRSKLPGNKMVLLYCNAGTLSSQAALALRVAGMENVRILQGGLPNGSQRRVRSQQDSQQKSAK